MKYSTTPLKLNLLTPTARLVHNPTVHSLDISGLVNILGS